MGSMGSIGSIDSVDPVDPVESVESNATAVLQSRNERHAILGTDKRVLSRCFVSSPPSWITVRVEIGSPHH